MQLSVEIRKRGIDIELIFVRVLFIAIFYEGMISTFFSEFRQLEDGSSSLVSLHTVTSTRTTLPEQ